VSSFNVVSYLGNAAQRRTAAVSAPEPASASADQVPASARADLEDETGVS